MHETAPSRYSLRSPSRSSMEVPRTPSPNQQYRSSSPKRTRTSKYTRLVLCRPEVVSPTPAARAYALKFHRRRRKDATLVLSNRDKSSQVHKPPYKRHPASSTLAMDLQVPTTVKLRASSLYLEPGATYHEPLAIYKGRLCTVNQTQPRCHVPSFKSSILGEAFLRVQASARSTARSVASWEDKADATSDRAS
jgi:hypothetical protein